MPESGDCLPVIVLRGAECMRKQHVSSQAVRNGTLQEALGFHMIRIGVLLHETEKLNKTLLLCDCVGLWFGFAQFKKEKMKTLSAPCSLPHYHAGKQTQYSSKQVGNSRPLFRVTYLRRNHFLQGQSGNLITALVA